MNLKRLWPFLTLFILGIATFFLPIREHDYMRLRYWVGIWFLAEAASVMISDFPRTMPLYQLVGRYPSWRDRLTAGSALALFLVALYLSAWFLIENDFFWAVKVGLAVLLVLLTWLIYYGICFLFGTPALRDGVKPKFRKVRP